MEMDNIAERLDGQEKWIRAEPDELEILKGDEASLVSISDKLETKLNDELKLVLEERGKRVHSPDF